jgi:hypothetical protein
MLGLRRWLRRASEQLQNADYQGIRCHDAEADRGDDGEAEDQGHEERNHVQPTLTKQDV